MKFYFNILVLLITVNLQAQQKAFVKLVQPDSEKNSVSASRQFIVGSTCKGCVLTINSKPVKVYSSGGFAFETNLQKGDSSFNLVAVDENGKSFTKKITYTYTLPKPPVPVRSLEIVSVETLPAGNLILKPGDKIKFKAKGLTGCRAVLNGKIKMYEMPGKDSLNKGIYQAIYTVKEADSFNLKKFTVTLTDKKGNTTNRETKNHFSILDDDPSVAITKDRLAFLEESLGEDRLGAPKLGYLDSNVLLNVTGKIGNRYRVQLTKNKIAYIPDDLVTFAPSGTFAPESLTGSMRVYGNEKHDFVTLELFQRLPYQSIQTINPSTIIVDVFGATNNTNWVSHLETIKEIKQVSIEQKQDEIFRITIELKHKQHWGHAIYYSGTNLVIKVTRQPENLSLSNLTIAVDAGHGGSNLGAMGPTGAYEKNLTLAISLKLQKLLQAEGAKVIMTRSREQDYENKQRLLLYRENVPDLLLSIHLNSAGDPIRAGGTSTFYKHTGFKQLGYFIYKRMLETGLKERSNTGNFNFILNSPTEYVNALVETLFISNPEEESMALDENFQQLMAEKIVMGVKDFLKYCEANK